MKKLMSTLIILTIVFAAGNVFAKDWKKIRVAMEGAYPPFNYVTSDGVLSGFDVDIAKALIAAAGAEIEIVTQDWDGIIPALLARKYDCIIGSMSITEERKKKIGFTKKYYKTPARFVAKKGLIPNFSKAALKGKTIGVQSATTHDRYLTDNYGKAVAIKRYSSQDQVCLDIVAGRLDMFIADSVVASDSFLNKEEGKDFEFVGPDLIDSKWFGNGAGIGVRKQDTDLVNLLNDAIDKIIADGTYKKIQDKHFGFDVYGN